MVIKSNEFKSLIIREISDEESLVSILERSSSRSFDDGEMSYAREIIDKCHSHTLLVELIGRQIANSYLSLKDACELMESKGVSYMASESIDYVRDRGINYDSIISVINSLVDNVLTHGIDLSEIKVLSIIHDKWIDVNLFGEMIGLDNKNSINALKEAGYIENYDNLISLHPIMKEAIRCREWDDKALGYLKNIIIYITKMLKSNRRDSEFPTELFNDSPEPDGMLELLKYSASKATNEIYIDRVSTAIKTHRTDLLKLQKWTNISKSIIDECGRIDEIRDSDLYLDLLYNTLYNMPSDKEDFILSHADEVILCGRDVDSICLMKLCDYIAHLFECANDYDNAYKYISLADEISTKARYNRHYVRAIYYEMVGDYYDFVLNGAYCGEDYKEQVYFKKLVKYNDKAIYHMRRSGNANASQALARYLLGKATLYIRNDPSKVKRIVKCLDEAEELINNYISPFSDISIGLDMTKCWYYAAVQPDALMVDNIAREAIEKAKDIYNSELAIIDEVYTPIANTFYELLALDESMKYLYEAIRICDKHEDELPYIRMKVNIYTYMCDVVIEYRDTGIKDRVLKEIEDYNRVLMKYGLDLINPTF